MTAVTARPRIDVERWKEALVEARALESAGDEAAAERAFREALDATRGSGEVVAWVALSNLTGLYMRQGRESETLILVRRVIEDAAPFEPFRLAWARQALCMALANIEDWSRLGVELPRFEASIAGTPEPHAAIFARSARALRVTIAISHGTVEEARAAYEPLLASLDASALPNTCRYVHLMGADVEQRSGRLAEALDAARRARPYSTSPTELISGVVVEAECLLELGDADGARDVVRDMLDRIDAEPGATFASAVLLRAGPHLAELVADRLGDDDLVRRTYDLAAHALVARAAEMQRIVSDLPELADPPPDDVASLAAFRGRFAETKRRFLRGVARVLGGRPGAASFLQPDRDGVVRVCAWCLQIRCPDGTWLPLGHFAAGSPPSRVTHGICDACTSAFDATVSACRD
jgi:tetratricopeptide (TPR) repeat protein